MKNIAFILTLSLALLACKQGENQGVDPNNINNPNSADGKDPNGKAPILKFTEEEFDFGNIDEDEIVAHTFKFKNTGNADLFIATANADCGCTIPKYSKEAIHPGDEGQIVVEFNSKGKQNATQKSVKVTYNGIPNTEIITIKAFVNPKNK